jgi:hypothetical protein
VAGRAPMEDSRPTQKGRIVLGSGSVNWRLCVPLLALALLGCAPSDSSSEKKPSLDDQDERLLSDPYSAGPELVRRLRALVAVRDGLIVIVSPLTAGVTVLPVNSSWAVICGAGISVHFGDGVAEHDGFVAVPDAMNVLLALTVVGPDTCRQLAPMIGKEVQAMIKNGGP